MNNDVQGEAFVPDLTGEDYSALLARLHDVLKPRTYFEIGTLYGDTLRLARCASVAVDPQFHIANNIAEGKPMVCLYQMRSDDFFRDYNPTAIFGRQIDFAFLDGLHLFEFLLRDFLNTEKYCRRNSVIAVHDCIPTDVYMAERTPHVGNELPQHEGWWTGDIWKVVLILKKYRPDLFIYSLDAVPTGLILLTNLDPRSEVLEREYFHIVAEFEPLHLRDYGLTKYIAQLGIMSTRSLRTPEQIAARLWL